MSDYPRLLRPCPRCGVARYVNEARKPGLCVDCRWVLTADERKLWAA